MEDAHDIEKEVRKYLIVFGALLILTVVTVAVSYLDVSLNQAIAIALFVATIKASLVACFFMHLISEKKVIYSFLIVTLIFFFALMTLPLATTNDPLVGTHGYGEDVGKIETHSTSTHH